MCPESLRIMTERNPDPSACNRGEGCVASRTAFAQRPPGGLRPNTVAIAKNYPNSNRYTKLIESPVSCRKQRPGQHSNRYKKRVIFSPPLSDCLASGTRFLTSLSKINRDILLIESPVSHRKQRTGARINRNISSTSQTGATRQ